MKASRLTYGDIAGHSAELFFRADHESGLFLKGFIGGGALPSGKMNDEDFPPGIFPYSNTLHAQSGGSLKYASIDLGYNVFSGILPSGSFQIGPFVGYHHLHERMNTFGCSQLSFNPSCATDPVVGTTPISTLYDILDEDITRNTLRAGIAGEVVILPGLRASLEAFRVRLRAMAYSSPAPAVHPVAIVDVPPAEHVLNGTAQANAIAAVAARLAATSP